METPSVPDWRELSLLQADVLPGLPLGTAVVVRLPTGAVTTLGVSERPAAKVPDGPMLNASECRLLAQAVEFGRAGVDDLTHWIEQKVVDPEFRVTEDVALSGLRLAARGRWTLGDVVVSLRAEVLAVVAEEQQITAGLSLAA